MDDILNIDQKKKLIIGKRDPLNKIVSYLKKK